MKTRITSTLTTKFYFFFILFVLQTSLLFAGQTGAITGMVADSETGDPVPFVHITLLDSAGSGFIAGTVSDIDGVFTLRYSERGTGILKFSAIGFETLVLETSLQPESTTDLGMVLLTFATISHEALTVTGEVTARAAAGQTSYFVNENMAAVSATGTDLLTLVPGVEVDIMQNISLEGSRNILIFVDGKERDRSFLSQLHPSQVSRIDILNMPPAGFDAAITGVINVVLNQKPKNELSGHIHLDVPALQQQTYLFPATSIHYGTGIINLFTSYNGEFSYFDVTEFSRRSTPANVWENRQDVRQQYWSHKFHYGLDLDLGDKHDLGFYGWLNPFSQENSGTAELSAAGQTGERWLADKKDEDSNFGAFYSVAYTFRPAGNNGSTLRADAAYQTLNASNTVTYSGLNNDLFIQNRMEPVQQTYRFRAGLTQPVGGNVIFETGFHATELSLRDRTADNYRYSHTSLAGYGSLTANVSQFEFTGGIRAEQISYGINSTTGKNLTALFPNASIRYQIPGTGQNIRLSYRRSARYPHLYQLSPVVTTDDPWSSRSGNPALDPAFRGQVNLEYNVLFGSSFLSANLFYLRDSRAIHTLAFISPEGIYESIWLNMGELEQSGIRFSGSLNLGDRTGIQPYLSLYGVRATPNSAAKEHGLITRQSFAYETGLSAFTGFGRGFMAAVQFQYASPAAEIQRSLFSGALYFITVEKSFGPDLKAGIVSALPFAKSFTYGGHTIDGIDFDSRSEGIIRTSAVPFWFTLNYRFSRGNGSEKTSHSDVIAPQAPRQGF
jgi:hypothetical protein